MKTLRTPLLLLAFGLLGLAATPASASASAYEYYSVSSGPSVCAAQITSITVHWGGSSTLYFADGSIDRDYAWRLANQPIVGGYIVVACSSAFSLASYEDGSFASETSFESDYSAETYAHGGHEPVVVILD